jgi:hypothetical protein
MDLNELQIFAQLLDNLNVLVEKLEKAYNKQNLEEFNLIKNEILETHKKMAGIKRK